MKKITLSLLLLSAMIIGTSCSDNNENQNGLEEGTASLTVSIKGQPVTRYSGGSTTTKPAAETVVSNFTVFVFNFVSGDLEKSQGFTVTPGNYTGKVTGLNTGTKKRVVAFVNVPTDLDLSTITTYDQLNNCMISLDSQNASDIATTGLFMSGECTNVVTLSPTVVNEISIPVKRRVAKIILKSLIINANTANLPNFALTGVSVQKARLSGTSFGPLVQPSGDDTKIYAGGIASPAGATPDFNLTRNYLLEALQLPADYVSGAQIITTENDEKYFYVLPNNDTNGNATLLALAGTFGTTPENAYYPFLINGSVGDGSTDGKFIESNKVYALSVIINKPQSPSEDPNKIPSQGGILDVTIDPQDWDVTINQTVEW